MEINLLELLVNTVVEGMLHRLHDIENEVRTNGVTKHLFVGIDNDALIIWTCDNTDTSFGDLYLGSVKSDSGFLDTEGKKVDSPRKYFLRTVRDIIRDNCF